MIVKPVLSKTSRIILFFLRIFGLWPGENPSIYYICYGYLIVLVFSLIFTASMVIQLFRLEDITKNTTEALYMTLIEVALVIKILNCIIRAQEILQMFRSAENFVLENNEEMHLLKIYVNNYFKFSMFYFLAAIYASSSADISAALSDTNDLPFSAWYPYFDWINNSRHFWMLWLYQAIGMFITAVVNVALEQFAALLMIMNSFQMEVLGMRLSKLGYSSNSDSIDKSRFSRAEMNGVSSKLIQYLKIHQDVLRYFFVFTKHYSKVFL